MTPAICFSTATLWLLGACLGCTALLIVAYIVNVTRMARLGERALEVLGVSRTNSEEPPSVATAYRQLFWIQKRNAQTEAGLKRGLQGLSYQDRVRLFGEDTETN